MSRRDGGDLLRLLQLGLLLESSWSQDDSCDTNALSLLQFRSHLEKARPDVAVVRVHRSRRVSDEGLREQPTRRKIQIRSGTLPTFAFGGVSFDS